MPKKIFKAGNYGTKGSYTKDDLQKWVGSEFAITAGHVGDWKNNGYPTTAIPIAGMCKAVGVDDDGYLLGEFNYNSFGNEIKDKYPNLSIGIGENGVPNHIAILGYAPPHLKDLDKSFSEFSQDLTSLETTQTIEFAEDNSIINSVLTLDSESQLQIACTIIDKLNATEANITGLSTLVSKIWDKQDLSLFIEKLQSQGYTVEKTSEFSKETLGNIANSLGFVLTDKPVENLSQKEMYEKIKAEFQRDNEKAQVKEKITNMLPPVMKEIIEFAIDKAFDEKEYSHIIEFSETDKNTMANKLKEFSKGENPFKDLFVSITQNIEFNDNKTDDSSIQERVGAYFK